MRFALLACLAALGCSKPKTDDCQRVMDKSATVLGEMSALRGARLGPAEHEHLVAQCRKQRKAGKRDAQFECVLAAKDDAAVRDCYIKGYEQYLQRSKAMEAQLQLTTIGKLASAYATEKGAFPTGKVGPTPAAPCCGEQMKQCLGIETTFSDPVWRELGFGVEGNFLFQYTYESDGKTFTATATGDAACSGKPTTTTITGKLGADGKPTVTKP